MKTDRFPDVSGEGSATARGKGRGDLPSCPYGGLLRLRLRRDAVQALAVVKGVTSSTKLPNFGWVTLRCRPITPSPAATATVLCATTQIRSLGKRSISWGKPTEGSSAR